MNLPLFALAVVLAVLLVPVSLDAHGLITHTVGEISWSEASYPTNKTATIRVVDPDMNKFQFQRIR